MEVDLGSARIAGVTVVVQNAAPYTYFGQRPVDMGEGATLQSGDLAGIVLRRASPLDIPTITWRALARGTRLAGHRQVHPFATVTSLTVRSLDGRPLPLQVDGDYIGKAAQAVFGVRPAGILVVS
jgi:diacylglycerol kinase family enzyme